MIRNWRPGGLIKLFGLLLLVIYFIFFANFYGTETQVVQDLPQYTDDAVVRNIPPKGEGAGTSAIGQLPDKHDKGFTAIAKTENPKQHGDEEKALKPPSEQNHGAMPLPDVLPSKQVESSSDKKIFVEKQISDSIPNNLMTEPILALPCPTKGRELMLLTALITKGHYEEDIYIDMFGLAKEYFKFDSPNKDGRGPRNKWVRVSERPEGRAWEGLGAGLLESPEKLQPALHCLVRREKARGSGGGGDGSAADWGAVPVEFMPQRASVDANVNGHTHIMRCKVTDFFSVDFLSKDAVVDVWLAQSDCSVLDRKAGNSTCNILGRFQVLLPAGATGLFGNGGAAAAAGSGYGHYRPGGLPTVEATLCAPGATSANLLFAEFAAHHALLGFDHVHLGVHHPPDSLKWAEFQAVLAPWLRSGRASLHSTWVPGLDFGDEGKQFFMHACLYHAKRHARWNAIWDFDEFLTPHNPNASLSSLIEKYTNNGEKELCWIQFSSFSVTKQNPEKKDSPWPTERYNFYDPANEVWKKSIANTKRIFSSGYHLPGACKHSSPKVVFERRIAQTRDDYQDFVGMVDPEDGGMHHYVNAFKNRYGPKKMQHEDEFGKYFFPKTLSKIIEMDPDIMDWRSRLHT